MYVLVCTCVSVHIYITSIYNTHIHIYIIYKTYITYVYLIYYMSIQPTGRNSTEPCSSLSPKVDSWRIPSHLGRPAFLFYSDVQCIYTHTYSLVALFLCRT